MGVMTGVPSRHTSPDEQAARESLEANMGFGPVRAYVLPTGSISALPLATPFSASDERDECGASLSPEFEVRVNLSIFMCASGIRSSLRLLAVCRRDGVGPGLARARQIIDPGPQR